MLTYLHVKNLAVVEDIEVHFGDKLNILTGETGVGKSVIIGSVNLALGGKLSTDMIRSGEDYALVEMAFEPNEYQWKDLSEYDIIPEDNQLIITRKYVNGRSSCKVNGEIVTLNVLRQIASVLIDIHGQHEHQSLLYPEKQLEIVDRFAFDRVGPVKEAVARLFNDYIAVKKEIDSVSIPEEERQREVDFLEYEIGEIEAANLKENEEEKLEEQYKKLNNFGRIMESLGSVYAITGDNGGVSYMLNQALTNMNQVVALDENMSDFHSTLIDVESILSDFNREVQAYINDKSFDSEEFARIEDRLDCIRKIYAKYGGTYEKTMNHYEEMCKKREYYNDYDNNIIILKEKLTNLEETLQAESKKLSRIRENASEKLAGLIDDSLTDLNFRKSCFTIQIGHKDCYSANGMDFAEFMITANPGEPARPLVKVASGGELSRIMLAIKTVLADSDAIHTLVFDEIDAGISGRTAQKVSEKLAGIANNHQVICITHLAQIAAMADEHYVIEKVVENERTKTNIRQLSYNQSVDELARILGGTKITESVISNAKEMKDLAAMWKGNVK